MADVDKWIEIAKECKYLNETDLKVTVNLITPKQFNNDLA